MVGLVWIWKLIAIWLIWLVLGVAFVVTVNRLRDQARWCSSLQSTVDTWALVLVTSGAAFGAMAWVLR